MTALREHDLAENGRNVWIAYNSAVAASDDRWPATLAAICLLVEPRIGLPLEYSDVLHVLGAALYARGLDGYELPSRLAFGALRRRYSLGALDMIAKSGVQAMSEVLREEGLVPNDDV